MAINNLDNPKVRLTKKDVQKSFWLWQFFSHANYNYERMQGTAFAMCMAPIVEKLYKTKEDIVAGLKRHLNFFNTEPDVGAVIHGVVIAMEEEKANGADISDEAINNIKVGLMGPLAGVGDALVQGVIIPIIVALGISLGTSGNLFGPILVMIGIPAALISIAYNSWMRGYYLGSGAVTSLLSQGKMQNIIGAAGILGCTVMGGLVSTFVQLQTTFIFSIGKSEFNIQEQLFNKIMPGLLPLGVTLGVYALLKSKKATATQIMIGLIVVAFVGGYLGIF